MHIGIYTCNYDQQSDRGEHLDEFAKQEVSGEGGPRTIRHELETQGKHQIGQHTHRPAQRCRNTPPHTHEQPRCNRCNYCRSDLQKYRSKHCSTTDRKSFG